MGCTTDVTVCHKWAKHICKYNNYTHCLYGVHYEPQAQAPPEPEPEPAAKRLKVTTRSSPQDDQDQVVELVTKMIKNEPLLSSPQATVQNHKDYFTRMLRTLHPDKASGTCLETVFTEITKSLLTLKEIAVQKEGGKK